MARKPQVSEAEQAARSRVLKGNRQMAEDFGVNVDYVREIVKVDALPDPPATEVLEKVVAGRKRNKPQVQQIDPEQYVMTVLREEAEEISIRLDRIGVPFGPGAQQQLVDYGMAILTGMVGGGAIARRQ